MISSKEILEKTGLKSSKTLTRWHKKGIIPEPLISTHPSGRGKMAYWPDWVLDKCLKIVELRKQGHSIKSALIFIEYENINKVWKRVSQAPSFTELLTNKQLDVENGGKINLLDVFYAHIINEIGHITTDHDFHDALITKMREEQIIDFTLHYINDGYNPILFFDGIEVKLMTDFLVAHLLSNNLTGIKPFVIIPLLSIVQKFFEMLGKEENIEDKIISGPAPLIWRVEGDAMVEYPITLSGPAGFELVRKNSKIIDLDSINDKNTGGKNV